MNTPTDMLHRAGDSPGQSHPLFLRNVYWLLAMSQLPAVLGAWIGVNLRITEGITGATGLVVFMLGAFGFSFALEKARDSAKALPVLLAFTFFMGLMLSLTLVKLLGFHGTGHLLVTIFGGLAATFFCSGLLAAALGRAPGRALNALLVGAVLLLVVGATGAFARSGALVTSLAVSAIALASAAFLCEVRRVLQAGKTSPQAATLDTYLSLFSMFQSVATLLGRFGDPRK